MNGAEAPLAASRPSWRRRLNDITVDGEGAVDLTGNAIR